MIFFKSLYPHIPPSSLT